MIAPILISPPNVTLLCDRCGWSADVALASLEHPSGADGLPNPNLLMLECGQCGSVTGHPVAGGAAPIMVQALFVARAMDKDPKLSFKAATAAIGQIVTAIEGSGRFQLSGTSSLQDVHDLVNPKNVPVTEAFKPPEGAPIADGPIVTPNGIPLDQPGVALDGTPTSIALG